MFDEQNQPVDIFAEVDPKGVQVSGGASRPFGAPPVGPNGQPLPIDSSRSRGPSKFIFILLVLIVLGGIGAGVWYFVLRDAGTKPESTTPITEQEDTTKSAVPAVEPEGTNPFVCGNAICDPEEEQTCPTDCAAPVSACGNGMCDPDETPEACPVDCPALPTEPVIEPEPANQPFDADGDGLSDEDERAQGTNPQVADTDGDGLSDREEVVIYKTNPTSPDTDGDSYIDGDEVKAGYNPNGSGKLLNLPQ